jgi:hypothetical protein
MKRTLQLSMLGLLLAWASAPPAFAQTSPVFEPPPPPKRSAAGKAIEITGLALTGVGTLTIMAAGITGLVASAEASRLDDECPNKRCVEGTPGGDSLESARDSARATEILLGIGLPVLTAGFVLMIYSGGFKKRPAVAITPRASPRAAGARVEVLF